MANETILPTAPKPTTNGQSQSEQSTKLVDIESPVLRATRILSGNIRANDYLPVSNDIIDFVAEGEARAGILMLPEYRQKMISELALQAHHAGNIVLSRHTSEGVIVLAVGTDDVDRLLESLSPEQLSLVRIEYPPTPFE